MERNVILYWVGKDYKLIKILRDLIYCHSKNGKGYNVLMINHDNIKEYIKDLPSCFYQLLPAHQADFVRVNVVCDFGGIWLDSDTLVLDKLDSLFDILDTHEGFIIKDDNDFLNGLFGSIKNSKLLLEWKRLINNVLHKKENNITWTELGSNIIKDLYYNNGTIFTNFKFLTGSENLYPVKWMNCEKEFLKMPYEHYKNIEREYQPLIILVYLVYINVEDKSEDEIWNSSMPITYFLKKSIHNISHIKDKENLPSDIVKYIV